MIDLGLPASLIDQVRSFFLRSNRPFRACHLPLFRPSPNTTFNHKFTCRANMLTLFQFSLWTALQMGCLLLISAERLS